MNQDFTRYSGWMSNAKFADRQCESANILTLCGEQATRRGYELFNANGDNLGAVLTDAEVEFIQEHRCTSDCRRIGCEAVYARTRMASIHE